MGGGGAEKSFRMGAGAAGGGTGSGGLGCLLSAGTGKGPLDSLDLNSLIFNLKVFSNAGMLLSEEDLSSITVNKGTVLIGKLWYFPIVMVM